MWLWNVCLFAVPRIFVVFLLSILFLIVALLSYWASSNAQCSCHFVKTQTKSTPAQPQYNSTMLHPPSGTGCQWQCQTLQTAEDIASFGRCFQLFTITHWPPHQISCPTVPPASRFHRFLPYKLNCLINTSGHWVVDIVVWTDGVVRVKLPYKYKYKWTLSCWHCSRDWWS